MPRSGLRCIFTQKEKVRSAKCPEKGLKRQKARIRGGKCPGNCINGDKDCETPLGIIPMLGHATVRGSNRNFDVRHSDGTACCTQDKMFWQTCVVTMTSIRCHVTYRRGNERRILRPRPPTKQHHLLCCHIYITMITCSYVLLPATSVNDYLIWLSNVMLWELKYAAIKDRARSSLSSEFPELSSVICVCYSWLVKFGQCLNSYSSWAG